MWPDVVEREESGRVIWMLSGAGAGRVVDDRAVLAFTNEGGAAGLPRAVTEIVRQADRRAGSDGGSTPCWTRRSHVVARRLPGRVSRRRRHRSRPRPAE
jgi:hypothetical protein